jgi:hypothetical protein
MWEAPANYFHLELEEALPPIRQANRDFRCERLTNVCDHANAAVAERVRQFLT